MYAPPLSREDRPEALVDAIREMRFAALVTPGPHGLAVSHVPFVVSREEGVVVLSTHVARANDHWRAVADAAPSVAIFQGPQAYVSPSLYASKREHGKVVPTWTYVAVHAHGPLAVVQDESWLADHLDALTQANESARPHPWAVGDAPESFVRALSRGIVGLRLTVERLEGAWKMNQHKSDADRSGVLDGLASAEASGARDVAGIMRELEQARRPG